LQGDKKAEFLQSGNRPAFRSFAVLHRIISDIVQKCGGCRLLRCNSADRRNGRIYDCMEYLPSAQKEALYLVYIEGMSYKEAAAVLRKSAKQIDKLLQLGKKKLRPLLETEGIKSAFND
jgi:RNA polymerase sigma factor (sigma-70 family)